MENNFDDKVCNVTNMPQRYCAHCNNLKIPVNKNEINGYSIRESVYLGNPIIEILLNGGPINDFDRNFMFGLTKAKMLMNCVEEIEEFAFLPAEKLRRKYKKKRMLVILKLL